jgi:hypothetical protein
MGGGLKNLVTARRWTTVVLLAMACGTAAPSEPWLGGSPSASSKTKSQPNARPVEETSAAPLNANSPDTSDGCRIDADCGSGLECRYRVADCAEGARGVCGPREPACVAGRSFCLCDGDHATPCEWPKFPFKKAGTCAP